jgi:hypothetical protein
MQGRDFAPLYLDDSPPSWRDEFFYEHAVVIAKDRIPASEAVVRKDWKYIRWPDFDYEEYFDLVKDPREEHNVASDPAYSSAVAEGRRRLAEWKMKVGPEGR